MADTVVNADIFHWDLWLGVTLTNWILDFSRPIVMLLIPVTWNPLNRPSLGDYFHLLYNVLTPLLFIKLYERTKLVKVMGLLHLLISLMTIGASIHLVGDSVNHRLVHSGYQLHVPLRENELMKELKPASLVESFDLLYYFDEVFGHYLWYIPYFAIVMIYMQSQLVNSTVCLSTQKPTLAPALAVINGIYYWYLSAEGQISPLLFLLFWIITLQMLCNQSAWLKVNGAFLMDSFSVAIWLTAIWVTILWFDPTMRQKYVDFWYMPEPWSLLSSIVSL